jgi:hypothetical protein
MASIVSVLYTTDLISNDGETAIIGIVRCSSQAALLTINGDPNAPETGTPANSQFPIRVSGTRKFGITARHIVIYRVAGADPNFYRVYRRIPVFTTTFFANALSAFAPSVSYEGLEDWILVGGQNERYHLAYGKAASG